MFHRPRRCTQHLTALPFWAIAWVTAPNAFDATRGLMLCAFLKDLLP
jgi:hypothetical protein